MKEKWKQILTNLIENMFELASENDYVLEDCYNAGMTDDDLKELGFEWALEVE